MSFTHILEAVFLTAWPTLTTTDLFRCSSTKPEDVEKVDELTFRTAEMKVRELSTLSTVSVFLAGVIATIYSWPMFEQAPWPARSFYGASFILSLAAIRRAMQQTTVLRQLLLHHPEDRHVAADQVREQLGNKNLRGSWTTSFWKQTVWNSATMYLNTAVVSLFIAFGWTIMAAAVAVNWDLHKPESKIAVTLTIVAGLLLIHYWVLVGVYSQYARNLQ